MGRLWVKRLRKTVVASGFSGLCRHVPLHHLVAQLTPYKDASDAASPEELLAMESSIATTKEALPALRTTFKTLTTALNAILSAPTTTELVVKIQELELENAAKKAKLQGFEDGSIKMVTKEELDRTEREHKYWAKVRKGRKDAGRNLWRMLADNLGEDKLREEVELDEDPYVG